MCAVLRLKMVPVLPHLFSCGALCGSGTKLGSFCLQCWERDPWDGLGSFGSPPERGSLSLLSLAPPINPGPPLPPVGSH